MLVQRTCRFCDIINEKFFYDGIDQPFATNQDFAALVSIGAFIEGWSLIIPKEHRISMLDLYTHPALIDILRKVIPSLVQRYGSLISFEHGSNKEGSITSCGTDHAHLHLVPFSKSLLPEMQDLSWTHCHASDLKEIVKENEYLFYSELGINNDWNNPLGYLHILEEPISQYFRQKLADALQCNEKYNYKLFPHLDSAKKTRISLAGSSF